MHSTELDHAPILRISSSSHPDNRARVCQEPAAKRESRNTIRQHQAHINSKTDESRTLSLYLSQSSPGAEAEERGQKEAENMSERSNQGWKSRSDLINKSGNHDVSDATSAIAWKKRDET
jgi:hypothetical protein